MSIKARSAKHGPKAYYNLPASLDGTDLGVIGTFYGVAVWGPF